MARYQAVLPLLRPRLFPPQGDIAVTDTLHAPQLCTIVSVDLFLCSSYLLDCGSGRDAGGCRIP